MREINVPVTVVQRIGRFMDRQLDPTGSAILHEEIEGLGVETYYNDEVEQFYGTEAIEGVRLKSGRKLDCSLLVVAAGTSPAIEIAKEAGHLTVLQRSANWIMPRGRKEYSAAQRWRSTMMTRRTRAIFRGEIHRKPCRPRRWNRPFPTRSVCRWWERRRLVTAIAGSR